MRRLHRGCIIAPVSSWAAAVTSAVPADSGINGFTMFLRTIPYNFYALLTLIFMMVTIVARIDYGPMKLHEDNALNGDLYTTPERPFAEDEENDKKANGTVMDMVLPVLFLIIMAIFFMLYTGGVFRGESVVDAFANCNAAKSLVMASMLTIFATLIFYKLRNLVSFHDSMDGLTTGFKSMSSPIIILILAWTLSSMTNLLGANIFIHDFVASQAGELKMFLPFIIFIISVVLSFATGTSWGIFTILIPIVCNVFPDSYEMLVISIAACLSGAVCGDHCSPISDTTIMSSAGARCLHVNHVNTQLPYAMTVAAVSGFGYLLAGIIGYNTGSQIALISLPVSIAVLVMVLFIIKKRTTVKA
jgi:tetracycline resistance efflux pump